MQNQQESSAHQTLCWRCEEVVHTLATQCPYCLAQLSKDKQPSQQAPHGEKITQLPTLLDQHPAEEGHIPQQASVGSTLIGLFLLFGGCNLLFLAILIALFSRDGFFTLQWKETLWPAFFGCSIALITFGILSFKNK